MAALIGIDIGTTAVKGVMIGLDGRRLDACAATYPTQRPGPGLVEQEPGQWWGLVTQVLERFAAHSQAGQVAVIGITSQVNTHVFCDAALAPLHPAITWADTRATAWGAALDARISGPDKTAALGAPIPIDASHALARMAWMAATHPPVWAATRAVMAPKDWVIARLTGVSGADAIASVGLCGPDHTYAAPLLALVPGAATVLPVLQDPLDIAGTVQTGPFKGIAVARGTMDAWAAMFGTGVAQDGQALNLSGTSEVLGILSATRHPVPGVITFAPWRGITFHAGPTQAGGAALDWAGRITGLGTAGAAQAATAATLHAASPLFLPHLSGERAPFWDGQARGTFAGLRASDGPGELALAVMEGVTFQARAVFDALEQAAGLRPAEIRAGGGGTQSDLWCQMRANTYGRPLLRMAARDAGAVGALVLAGVAAGLIPDLARAAAALVPQDRRFDPDPDAARLADRRHAIWRDLYDQIRPVNARLAAQP